METEAGKGLEALGKPCGLHVGHPRRFPQRQLPVVVLADIPGHRLHLVGALPMEGLLPLSLTQSNEKNILHQMGQQRFGLLRRLG